MSEKANTGGLTEIRYKGDESFNLDKDRENAINEAYKKADERKRREKLIWIMGIIFIIIIFGIVLYLLLR